jgi:hypothetical protein
MHDRASRDSKTRIYRRIELVTALPCNGDEKSDGQEKASS